MSKLVAIMVAVMAGCGGSGGMELGQGPFGGKSEDGVQTDRWGGYQHQYPSGKLTDGTYIDADPVVRGGGRQYFYVDLSAAPKEGPVNLWIRPRDAGLIGTEGHLTINVGLVGEKEALMDARLMHFYIGPDGQQQALTAETALMRLNDLFLHKVDNWVEGALQQRDVVPEPGWAWGPWKLFVLRDDHSSARIGGVLLNFPCHDGCPTREPGDRELFMDIIEQLGFFNFSAS